MNGKRILLVLLCLVLSGTVCVFGGGTKDSSSGDIVTIQYADWDKFDTSFIDEWNKTHPNIQVVFTPIPDNGEQQAKVDVLAMSGDLDIMPIQNGSQFLRMENGVLAPLDNYFKRDNIDVNTAFGPSFSEWMKLNGTFYCLPLRANMVGVYYNKDMFDAKGIPYPSDDWTIDDYIEIAKKLTSGSGQSKVYGTYLNSRNTEWAHTALSGDKDPWYTAGGGINVAGRSIQRALSLRKELDDGGYQRSFNEINAGKILANAEFLGGHSAMAVCASWLTRDMKNKGSFPFNFRAGVAYLPRFDKNTKSRVMDMSVSVLGIPANSKHKDEAWEFIKYYIFERSDIVAKSGNVPGYLPGWTNDVVDVYVQGSGLSVEDGRKFFDASASFFPTFPIRSYAGQYLQIINDEVPLYFNGERSLQQITGAMEAKYKALAK
jgi:multiple sugar transport system substrate-binding protein